MRVRITGHPPQNPELEDIVGRIGTVAETRERPEGRGSAYRITDIPGGDVWLAEGHVERVAEEEEGAA